MKKEKDNLINKRGRREDKKKERSKSKKKKKRSKKTGEEGKEKERSKSKKKKKRRKKKTGEEGDPPCTGRETRHTRPSFAPLDTSRNGWPEPTAPHQ